LDPAVYRTMDTLREYLKKMQEYSFTMMIDLHTEECKTHDHPKEDEEPDTGRRSIVASERKPAVDEKDIPAGCHPDDIKAKWLSYPDLPGLYDAITTDLLLSKLFEGKEERLVHDVFIYKLAKEYPEFLKSHQLRKIVFGQIVDRMFQ